MTLTAGLRVLFRRTAAGFLAIVLFGSLLRTLLHLVVTLVLMTLPTGLSVLFGRTTARVVALRSGAAGFVILHRSSAITTVRMFTAFAADLRHVLAVRAHRFAALAACLACLLRIEFMGGTLFVSGSPALTRNFTLTFLIHRSKSTIGSIFFCHCHDSSKIYGF